MILQQFIISGVSETFPQNFIVDEERCEEETVAKGSQGFSKLHNSRRDGLKNKMKGTLSGKSRK